MPHINHVLRGFYKKYPESVEISLESIGESPTTTKPTILVICTSVNKVRSILTKSLVYDKSVYGLKVCRGKVVRSRKQGARRSLAKDFTGKAANADHQERPSNGASIGAYVGERHLPPVSFGGLIMVDDKAYGMTVHHMLDDPSESEEEDPESESQEPILRSSANYLDMPDLTHSEPSIYSSGDEEYMYTLSDYESDFSDNEENEDLHPEDETEDDTQDATSSTSNASALEPGDILGIPAGCGESYIITQPAIDDVGSDFYPDDSTRDEEHLDSCTLGEVYASSGIRRRVENNIIHEIDWALFEFASERQPESNHISGSKHLCPRAQYPIALAPANELSGLKVHCMARTSGLQSGKILPGMVIVKIYGRQTPSSSYQVAGNLGVPGDSGAWVVDNEQGRACGHVLAWSSKKRVAYICPMDVLVRDIGQTLDAGRVAFPGGENVFSSSSTTAPIPSNSLHVEDEDNIIDNQAGSIEHLLQDLKLPLTPSKIDGINPSTDQNIGIEKENTNFFPIRLVEGKTRQRQISQGSMDYTKSARMEHWNGHEQSFTLSAEEVDSGIEVDDGAH